MCVAYTIFSGSVYLPQQTSESQRETHLSTPPQKMMFFTLMNEPLHTDATPYNSSPKEKRQAFSRLLT